MPFPIDETHDRALTSWVQSANDAGTDFPVQNLPFGVFRRNATGPARIGVAIGDAILDLAAAVEAGLLGDAAVAHEACRASTLNALMALPRPARLALRRALSRLLRSEAGDQMMPRVRDFLSPMALAEKLLPAHIGDYTDFYASLFHATNVGSMFRPDNPLLPNYKYVPIGYHGRASSVVPRRHAGQATGGADPRRCHATAGLRADAPARLRGRDRVLRRNGQCPGYLDPDWRGRRPHLRPLSPERLVGARRADLGVPASRALPRQEFLHHHFTLGSNHGSAGTVPRAGICACGRRSRAAALPRR